MDVQVRLWKNAVSLLRVHCSARMHVNRYVSLTLWFLANVNSRSRLLYVVVRPSVVCRLSVCNVRAPYSGD